MNPYTPPSSPQENSDPKDRIVRSAGAKLAGEIADRISAPLSKAGPVALVIMVVLSSSGLVKVDLRWFIVLIPIAILRMIVVRIQVKDRLLAGKTHALLQQRPPYAIGRVRHLMAERKSTIPGGLYLSAIEACFVPNDEKISLLHVRLQDLEQVTASPRPNEMILLFKDGRREIFLTNHAVVWAQKFNEVI